MSLKSLHENQRKILDYLLNTQSATLEELATQLGVTRTAAREHVMKLETLGYLMHADARAGRVGRPQRNYTLTSEGQEEFPRQYSWLSNELLAMLAKDLGPAGSARLMKSLADKIAADMAPEFASASSSAQRLTKVTEKLNELGYRASLKQIDSRKGGVIEATNCVYHSVAKRHRELCQFDVRFIENTSRMNVKLESCIALGDSVCTFCIGKK